MNKKILIPTILSVIIVIVILSTCLGGGRKIKLEYTSPQTSDISKDSIDLRVYVENSGSMDAYMCDGSNLKDAVFDYVSDLKHLSSSCSLYYINSKIIPYRGDLNSYIKDLTPASFAKAGGDRSNTDLMQIFDSVMSVQRENNKIVSIFVSDCILDIPKDAINFLGRCQVSLKNTFNDAIAANPYLGVQIIKLESKFDGFWFCGKNKKHLSNVKRPYYIWVIGDQRYLAKFNKEKPIDNIIGGIENSIAYATSQPIPYEIEKKSYVVNHTGVINIEIKVNLRGSLIRNIDNGNFKCSNENQVAVESVKKITEQKSAYSHIVELSINNPATIKSEDISLNQPKIVSWVTASSDETGDNIEENMSKTTGLLSLIKGVSEAFKKYTVYGQVSFRLRNK